MGLFITLVVLGVLALWAGRRGSLFIAAGLLVVLGMTLAGASGPIADITRAIAGGVTAGIDGMVRGVGNAVGGN